MACKGARAMRRHRLVQLPGPPPCKKPRFFHPPFSIVVPLLPREVTGPLDVLNLRSVGVLQVGVRGWGATARAGGGGPPCRWALPGCCCAPQPRLAWAPCRPRLPPG
jgi:hypothetical protein